MNLAERRHVEPETLTDKLDGPQLQIDRNRKEIGA